MSNFRSTPGFHDLWRPLGRPWARPEEVLGAAAGGQPARDRLARIVRGAPQAIVGIKGALKTPARLRVHLDYVSRKGHLALEEADGGLVRGRDAVHELAEDWSWAARADSRDFDQSLPIAVSMVLSMPRGVEAGAVGEAARAFARTAFAPRFDYTLVLHRDAQPHVHLCVRSLGREGERLKKNPSDIIRWREGFAAALRDQGLDADATPRWIRGVVHRAEDSQARRVRVRHEKGEGDMGLVVRRLLMEAAGDALEPPTSPAIWHQTIQTRQAQVRGFYLEQAEVLKRSPAAEDRALGQAVEAFVRDMPPIETQRQQIARLVRAENERLQAQNLQRQPERER